MKLDFLKSPGKSGSARSPRGMKLGIGGRKQATENFFVSLQPRFQGSLLPVGRVGENPGNEIALSELEYGF